MSETRTPPVDPRLLRYARASRGFFVGLAAIALAQTALIVAFAWLVTQAITSTISTMDASGPASNGASGSGAAALPGILIALTLVVAARALLIALRDGLAAHAAARVERQLREAFVGAVTQLGPGWVGERNTARLTLVAGRGLEALDAYFGRYLPQLVQTAIATPIIVAVMWANDWISGLTVVLTIPTIPVFMVLIGLATRSVQNKQWQTLSRLAARFSDTVHGLSTLKVFGRQHRAASRIDEITNDYRRETMTVLRVSFLSGFALELLASIAVAIVAVEVGFRLLGGSLVLGIGLFVLLLAPEAFLPLRQVGVQFHAAAEGVAATSEVFAVLDEARSAGRGAAGSRVVGTARPFPQDATPRAGAGHRLELDGVAVHRGENVLAPVSFAAEPGTVTLVVGPSGAGKSSLLAALRGAAAYDGTITIDGTDAGSLTPPQWLAWAGQAPGLVRGTVAENVALGDPVDHDAPDAEARAATIAEALRLAAAHPGAGITPELALGAQGAGLSGGQAQRVAVARAIHRVLRGRAGVLALDEPSSALDASTEAELWQNLRAIADRGTTVVVVSHRASARAIARAVVTLGAPASVAPSPEASVPAESVPAESVPAESAPCPAGGDS
ncbi:thiol reductant ABC exporter subunit CydD [uncultured Microbacterium sp.]|uniref:thiol reductant ABC exporter subunit CydD n=1 Tax=uncultured Microbacterium sp. TaxID=191216 RepID=UPI0025E1AF27|nr:thiol reductant ABC exporter subunit CydD [uncultured Microbacterium sp.]